MITQSVLFISVIIHVAAGRGCARAARTAIIYVAGADSDSTYGAYVATEYNAFNIELSATVRLHVAYVGSDYYPLNWNPLSILGSEQDILLEDSKDPPKTRGTVQFLKVVPSRRPT